MPVLTIKELCEYFHNNPDKDFTHLFDMVEYCIADVVEKYLEENSKQSIDSSRLEYLEHIVENITG